MTTAGLSKSSSAAVEVWAGVAGRLASFQGGSARENITY